MAETSGFMTDLPQSAYLSLSMRRAISAAQQRSHRYVTLEHLLLSLLDDPNAIEILEGLRADLPAIRVGVTETVNRNLASLYTPGEFDLRASYKVERTLQAASDDADRLGCDEVDAAFILAAVARETDDLAGKILQENGFAYSAAVTWLYANRGRSPASRMTTPAVPAAPDSTPTQESAPEPPSTSPQAPEQTSSDIEQETLEPPGEEVESPAASSAKEEEPLELDLELVEESEHEKPPATARQHPPSNTIADKLSRDRARRPTAEIQSRSKSPGPPDQSRADVVFQDFRERPTERDTHPVPQRQSRLETGGADSVSEGVEDRQGAIVVQRRPAPQLPPSSRLDEMRVRSGAAKSRSFPPAPAPAPPVPKPEKKRSKKRKAAAAEKTPTPTAERQNERGRRQGRRPQDVLIGRLVENIPRRMRAAVADRVEVRISREEIQILARRMEGRADPVRHEVMITQTMSVALRAPDGGFNIESLSPETQWIFDRPDSAETYGRWRWVVTPNDPGQRRLQLIVAARSVGLNGHVGDSALPDQVITVRVRTNYWRSLKRGISWILVMITGGVLTELAMHAMRSLGQ